MTNMVTVEIKFQGFQEKIIELIDQAQELGIWKKHFRYCHFCGVRNDEIKPYHFHPERFINKYPDFILGLMSDEEVFTWSSSLCGICKECKNALKLEKENPLAYKEYFEKIYQ